MEPERSEAEAFSSEGLKATIDAMSGALVDAVPPDPQFAPIVRLDRLSAAVVDRSGRLLHADGLFAGQEADILDLAGSGEVREADERVVVLDWTHPDGEDMPVAVGRGEVLTHWTLPPAARACADRAPGATVLLTAGAWRAEGALDEACAAFGATPGQVRIIAALVRAGDVRGAARLANVRYDTARAVVGEAMALAGVRKHAALISRIVSLSFGVLPSEPDHVALMTDLWGLTPRQAAIARAVTEGASRAQAASAVGVSEATAKKELQNIFLSAGVTSAGALSRKVIDAMSLSVLARVTGGSAAVSPVGREPLRFCSRPGGGVIAFSDYGPSTGEPVLVLHTSFGTRPTPSRLVEALQGRGWRPIAIDRPGFGLTDAAPGPDQHLVQAVEDLETVLSQLKIERIAIIARGGVAFLAELARKRPHLTRRVVLVSVPAPGARTSARASFYGLMQAVTRRSPHLLGEITRRCAVLFPIADIRRNIIDSLRGCPADVAALEDDLNFADYWRGLRMFATGRIEGFVIEQQRLAALPPPDLSHLAGADWAVVIGDLDPMYDPGEAAAWWRSALPGVQVRRHPAAGRMMVFTHPHAIVDALDQDGARAAA